MWLSHMYFAHVHHAVQHQFFYSLSVANRQVLARVVNKGQMGLSVLIGSLVPLKAISLQPLGEVQEKEG